MLYSSSFMLLLALFRGAQFQVEPTTGYLFSLLYLAVFGSVIAFGSYLTLLGHIGLDRAAYVTILFPIIALLLSTFYEGLQWGIPQLMGVALVLVGNAVVLTRSFKVKLPVGANRESYLS
jgi:drug/metabolite transporter (DMT)-like permease